MSFRMKKILSSLLLIKIICWTFVAYSMGNDDKSYLNPPKLKSPQKIESYSPESRKFSGIPSLAVSREGRMWAVWYTGITPGEDSNNYVVVATSGDKGETWEEVLVIDPDGAGPVRAYDPEIWIDPDGQLWVFWAQHIKPARSTRCGVWAITNLNAETSEPKWSDPKRLVDGVMMCKPIVLSTGKWVLPVSFWHLWEESAGMVVSNDRGETWQVRGAVNVPKDVRNHDEHMIVERKDDSLLMLVRTKYGIGQSISKDRGFTWTPLVPSPIQHPAARFFIYRLYSGNLLLVKHGPIDMRTGRSHLMAFISKDGGYSWSNGLLLDERPGVSYPDGVQTSDGTIHIIYDYNRRADQNILVTGFTEDDILSGSDRKILDIFKNRRVVSAAGDNR